MIIIEKNAGTKLNWLLEGSRLTFEGSLSLELTAYELDDPSRIWICADKDGRLFTAVSPVLAYAALLELPARRYVSDQKAVYEGDLPVVVKHPLPLDPAQCRLTLWAVEPAVKREA